MVAAADARAATGAGPECVRASHVARDGHVGRAGRAAAAQCHDLAGEARSRGGGADGGSAAVD
eukprot:4675411-Prymnesium_polylepis.1